MPQLAITIVSWNTLKLLERCIETIHASLAGSSISYEIMVVDNASSDGTPMLLRTHHPEIRLLEAGRNLGFAGGHNLALRVLLNAASPPEYLFLLNPDTEIVGDAIPVLVRFLEQHPEVALVGPQLCYPDGSIQSSRRRFPTPGVFFWESTPLETYWPNNPWARRYRCAGTPDDQEQAVDWLVGAALLVRRSAIEQAGLLDAGFQLYSEELEWQRRIGAHNPSSIIYLPSAVIIHHEGKSSEQAPARRYIFFQRSRLRYIRQVYGKSLALIFWMFIRAAYTSELLIELTKWLLGHKRPLRAQRIAVYRQVLQGLTAKEKGKR